MFLITPSRSKGPVFESTMASNLEDRANSLYFCFFFTVCGRDHVLLVGKETRDWYNFCSTTAPSPRKAGSPVRNQTDEFCCLGADHNEISAETVRCSQQWLRCIP